MWFEILPSFTIIVVAASFPHMSAYVVNKLVFGNMYRRSLVEYDQRIQYLRDRRIAGGNGNPYVVKGLEAIPD